MRKVSLVSFVILLAVTQWFVFPVSAANQGNNTNYEDAQARRKARLEQLRATGSWGMRAESVIRGIGDCKPEEPTADETNDQRVLRRKGYIECLLRRLRKRIDLYERFIDKLESRKEKLSSEGRDVTRLDGMIKTAQARLTEVNTTYDQVQAALKTIDYSGDAAAVREKVKQELAKLNTVLQGLHRMNTQAVSGIKASVLERLKNLDNWRGPKTWPGNPEE